MATTTRRDFQVFAKPGGAICNLDCHYCYYLEKEGLYPEERTFRMGDDLLEEYIAQQMEASSGESVRFSWHGGEPTILGVEYYRTIASLQKKHAPPGKRIFNALVTNGTLLDEEWCRFLAANHFLVGLSIDGPRELNTMRKFRNGRPAFDTTIRALGLLKEHGVEHNILVVISRANVEHSSLHSLFLNKFPSLQ